MIKTSNAKCFVLFLRHPKHFTAVSKRINNHRSPKNQFLRFPDIDVFLVSANIHVSNCMYGMFTFRGMVTAVAGTTGYKQSHWYFSSNSKFKYYNRSIDLCETKNQSLVRQTQTYGMEHEKVAASVVT
jgi:hypothetical protein